MKKLFILLAVAMAAVTTNVEAQSLKSDMKKNVTKFEEGTNAIGIRFGALQTEISYQKFLSDMTRMEADLGFLYTNGIQLNLAYQYVRPIGKEQFSYYFGFGPGVGFAGSSVILDVFGQIGIEYRFNAPFSVSLDWRPTFRILGGTGFYADGIALSVRYRF